jgi:hypothetical protein
LETKDRNKRQPSTPCKTFDTRRQGSHAALATTRNLGNVGLVDRWNLIGLEGVPMESRKKLFVVMRRYGPPYDPLKPLEAQLDWEGHRVFMNALEAEGLARLGGTAEVLLVFRAESEEEIDARLRADPWTQSGILSTARVVRWNLRIGEVG